MNVLAPSQQPAAARTGRQRAQHSCVLDGSPTVHVRVRVPSQPGSAGKHAPPLPHVRSAQIVSTQLYALENNTLSNNQGCEQHVFCIST